MAKFIPFATTNLIDKPYTDGYMWVDKETGQIRFDVDGVSVYAAGATPVDPEEPTAIEYKNLAGIPIKVVDSLDIFGTLEQADYPFYFTWTADTLEENSVTLLKHGIYVLKDNDSAPVMLAGASGSGSGGVTDYNALENKPIKRSNLSSTSSLSDGTYYLNGQAGTREFNENPTSPDSSQVTAIYYNPYISIDTVGQDLVNMPWDTAKVEVTDGMSARFLQLIGADTIENSGVGIYVAKIPMLPLGDLYYIIAGVPSFNSEPQVLLQYSADFGPDAMDSGMDAWGWIESENFELATKSPLALLNPFAFNSMANKEYWDTWFSTSDAFASSFDFEADTIYRYDNKAFKKIDGNAIEPVDKLGLPSEALNHKVVYNKSDNQLYECKEMIGAKTDMPISYASLLPAETTWSPNGTGDLGSFHVNTSLDVDTVKAIFANDNSGTLITAYDSCGTTPHYVSYRHSGDVLQIIDNTDSCSARTIFDSSSGGWQTSSGGWGTGTSSGNYAYPAYTLKSSYNKYNMQLSDKEAPKGCLFSAADGGFAGCKLIDGIYLNVHEDFDGKKMFAGSSQPMLQVVAHAADKQTKYGLMFALLDAFGAAGGWSILLENWETEQIYPLYAEKAFEWVDAGLTVTTPGWQSEYVDLTTGKLKVPYDGSISDIGRTLLYLPGEMDVTEDILGNYLSAAPFTKIEGVYAWSKLAGDSDTLNLSSNTHRIIQPTTKALEINQSNSADNIIVLGSVDDITVKDRALKTLTYIGRCETLRLDFTDWSNSSEVPYINLIGDGSATIVANRADIKATDSVSIREYNQDNSGYANWCSIETPGIVEYYLARENNVTYQPIIVKCDRFNLHNDNNLSRYNLHRSISADCRIFNIYGDTDFLHNEKNKYDTRTGGSSLTLKMPIESDGCYAFPNAGPGSIIGDKYLFVEPDTCNSSVYKRSWKTIQEYVDSKASGSNAGNASSGPNPTILAKSNGPVDAYDTCATYGAMYLNRFFPDNFDSSVSYTHTALFYGDGIGALPCIDYTAHDPASLHIYVYDGSYGADMSGGISQEIYKDGAWVIDPSTYTLSPGGTTWKMNRSVSKDLVRIISQLFSTKTKNGNSTGVTSAENAWTYIPLADVPDSIVPPNLCDNDFSKGFNYTTAGSFYDIYPVNAGGSKALYQCIWEGNLTWGSSTHAVRVAFRPIWSNFRSTGPITFTSESIAGNTLTLSSQIDEAGYYPRLVLMLNDGTTAPGGTLYWKRLYVI